MPDPPNPNPNPPTPAGGGINPGSDPGNPGGAPAPTPPTPPNPAPPANPPAPGPDSGDKLFSQADLDRIVKERLQEEQKRAERKLSDAQKQADDAKLREQGEFKTLADQYKTRVEELEAEIKSKERDALCLKIAAEEKLPPDLAPRLVGDDEAAIRADAQRLFKLMGPPTAPNPQGGKQGGGSGTVFDAIREGAKKEREQHQPARPLEEALGVQPSVRNR